MSSSTVSELALLQGLVAAKKVVIGLSRPDSKIQAVLLYGSPGAGKRSLSKSLAKAWMCVNPGDRGACGECKVCAALARGRSADLLVLEPLGKSKLIKLGAIVKTDPPDEDFPVNATEFVRTSPLSARCKVVIIEDADRMNGRAANALLKTLEEPPPYARFILTTSTVGSILPTILSRCVAVACELPAESDFPDWVNALSAGAPGRAREVLEHEEVYRALFEFGSRLGSRHRRSALATSEEFAKLADALESARKLNARAANAEALEVLAASFASVSNSDPSALQAMIEAHRRIQGNGHPTLIFDALFASILRES